MFTVRHACEIASLDVEVPATVRLSILLASCLRLVVVAFFGQYSSAAGSDDIDTDWDRELGLVGPGQGRTGEPSPNNTRDLKRANIAEGLKALLRGAGESAPQEGKGRP